MTRGDTIQIKCVDPRLTRLRRRVSIGRALDATPQISAFVKLKLVNCAPTSGLRNSACACNTTRTGAGTDHNRGYLLYSLFFTRARANSGHADVGLRLARDPGTHP